MTVSFIFCVKQSQFMHTIVFKWQNSTLKKWLLSLYQVKIVKKHHHKQTNQILWKHWSKWWIPQKKSTYFQRPNQKIFRLMKVLRDQAISCYKLWNAHPNFASSVNMAYLCFTASFSFAIINHQISTFYSSFLHAM